MNEYDSSKMVDILSEAHGYELTSDESEADLLLLNTCSVREKAQERSFISWVAGDSSKSSGLDSRSVLAVVLRARKGRR